MDVRTFTEGYDNGSEDASKGLPKRYRPIRATAPGGDYRRGYDAGYADHGAALQDLSRCHECGERFADRAEHQATAHPA